MILKLITDVEQQSALGMATVIPDSGRHAQHQASAVDAL